jgi:hypothetical protein
MIQTTPLNSKPEGPAARAAVWAGRLIVLAHLGLLTGMAAVGWPPPHMDGVLFWTTALNIRHGNGAVYGIIEYTYEVRGTWNADFHTQMYPQVMAFLARGGDFADLTAASLALTACTSVVGFLLYVCLFRTAGFGRPVAGLFAAGMALATGNVMLRFTGRPEVMFPLVMTVFALLRMGPALRRRAAFVDGVEVGLLAAISPAPAAAYGLLRCGWVVATSNREGAIGACLLRGVTAVVIYSAWVELVTPYSAYEVIKNTVGLGPAAYRGIPLKPRDIPEFLFVNQQSPLMGFLVVAAGGAAVAGLRNWSSVSPVRRWTTTLCVLCGGLYLLNYGILRGSMYNVLPLAVFMVELALGAYRQFGRFGRGFILGSLALVGAGGLAGQSLWAAGLCARLQHDEEHARLGAELAEVVGSQRGNERIVMQWDVEPPFFTYDRMPFRMIGVLPLTPEKVREVERVHGVVVRTLLTWVPRDGPPVERIGPYRLVKVGIPSAAPDTMLDRLAGSLVQRTELRFAVYTFDPDN